MARKKGRDLSGWVVVDKPAGITSTAVVNKLRWAFDAKKAGHAGTLDPQATGVLAVALGEATKTVPYITDALKCYRFTIRFGAATDTDDAEGTVIATSDLRPSDDAIRAALPALSGQIMQVPPQFSAVKVEGERAYALAREGEVMDLAARPLWVESLDLTGRPDADHAELEMVCGKGGYVRAIARDLGRALGCLAHVTVLRREWSGPFEAKDGVSLARIEELARSPEIDALLLPLEVGLADLPEVRATPEGAARLRNGNPGMVIAEGVEYGEPAWASDKGRAVAVGIYRAGELHPARVFNLPAPAAR
ncbi:MAG: tRNA pseudouridine(55) synthase TruB [Alphaproteobacteria bacterium HGW-Alphaproteobacteria-6]|nr:MAG: tRNA pseudouridine(55) synthase TruB [Alphaproteobacteria bacterium HGW-Alphaproteobacteria-6]